MRTGVSVVSFEANSALSRRNGRRSLANGKRTIAFFKFEITGPAQCVAGSGAVSWSPRMAAAD